jgi:hypothetical protein
MFKGVYWVKEWDDTQHLVSVESFRCPSFWHEAKWSAHIKRFGSDDTFMVITYQDGTKHTVDENHFKTMNQGLASDSDCAVRPKQCWSPPPSSGRR